MAKLKFVSSKDVKVIEVKKKREFFNIGEAPRREFKLETGERLHTNFLLEDEQLYIDVITKCPCKEEFVIYDIGYDVSGRPVSGLKALYVTGETWLKEFSDAIQAEKQKRQ